MWVRFPGANGANVQVNIKLASAITPEEYQRMEDVRQKTKRQSNPAVPVGRDLRAGLSFTRSCSHHQ